MIALALIAIGTLINESASSVGKWAVRAHKESLYTMGFLDLFWVTIVFTAWVAYTGTWALQLQSLPYFFIRAIVELCVLVAGLKATARVDRGTYTLITVLTIPLVLVVDYAVGFNIPNNALWGMLLIIVAFIILFARHSIDTKGIKYAFTWTIGVVATIALFKHNITYYNTVEGEQFWMTLILLAYVTLMAVFHDKKNPLRAVFVYPSSLQSLARGLAVPILNFSYALGVASVIVTGKRAFSIIWALASGSHYFHERHIVTKILGAILVIAGIICLAL